MATYGVYENITGFFRTIYSHLDSIPACEWNEGEPNQNGRVALCHSPVRSAVMRSLYRRRPSAARVLRRRPVPEVDRARREDQSDAAGNH